MSERRAERDAGPQTLMHMVSGKARADLLEREAELTGLSRALAAARQGAGSVLVVEGPAGIGKSRLLAAVTEVAGDLGMPVCKARGIELERDAAFGVAAELFAASVAGAAAEERAQVLSGHAALAASLFIPPAPGRLDSRPDAPAIVRGLYWLTVSLASDARCGGGGPAGLLIEVDDAQ